MVKHDFDISQTTSQQLDESVTPLSTEQDCGRDHQGLRASFWHPLGWPCHCLSPEGSADLFLSAPRGS